jgi:hypothetical protein
VKATSSRSLSGWWRDRPAGRQLCGHGRSGRHEEATTAPCCPSAMTWEVGIRAAPFRRHARPVRLTSLVSFPLRSADIHWPNGLRATSADVFAHNEIVIEAPAREAWQHLIAATAWPGWYSNAANVLVNDTTEFLAEGVSFGVRVLLAPGDDLGRVSRRGLVGEAVGVTVHPDSAGVNERTVADALQHRLRCVSVDRGAVGALVPAEVDDAVCAGGRGTQHVEAARLPRTGVAPRARSVSSEDCERDSASMSWPSRLRAATVGGRCSRCRR